MCVPGERIQNVKTWNYEALTGTIKISNCWDLHKLKHDPVQGNYLHTKRGLNVKSLVDALFIEHNFSNFENCDVTDYMVILLKDASLQSAIKMKIQWKH